MRGVVGEDASGATLRAYSCLIPYTYPAVVDAAVRRLLGGRKGWFAENGESIFLDGV